MVDMPETPGDLLDIIIQKAPLSLGFAREVWALYSLPLSVYT